jgi:preprotein translocase subunit SecF
LKKSAILSVIYSMIAVLVYVWFRFDLMYAPGAVFCLVHDVMITVGLFSIFQKEFGLTTLAALLTLVGYSLNDTIVTFDRIRENIGSSGTTNLEAIINRSVNEMLGRTLLTNLTVLFAVLALFWKGGGVVHDFAFTMIVGVFVGSYSTIFVSAPLVIWMDKVIAKRGKAPVRARAPKNA